VKQPPYIQQLSALALAMALGACAATHSRSETVQARSCNALKMEIAAAERQMAAAAEAGRNAWKSVIPVMVAMEYAKSHADANAAGERKKVAQAQYDDMGCAMAS
jgi:hypothetical protein